MPTKTVTIANGRSSGVRETRAARDRFVVAWLLLASLLLACQREPPALPGMSVEIRDDGVTIVEAEGVSIEIDAGVDVLINDVSAHPFDVLIETHRLDLRRDRLIIGRTDFGSLAPGDDVHIREDGVFVAGENRGRLPESRT